MNKLWPVAVLLSGVLVTIAAPDLLQSTMFGAVDRAFTLSMTLLPSYVIWSGILELMTRSGLDGKVVKLASPVVGRLFPTEDEKTRATITMTFVANLLGMNGAATPLAVQATRLMDDGTGRATKSQVLFTVVNATSLSLVPTTVVALRLAHGSANPSDIILPSLIVSIVATVMAVLFVKVLKR